jgi:hypothetical protein
MSGLTQAIEQLETLIVTKFASMEERIGKIETRLIALEAGFDMFVTDAKARNIIAATTPIPRTFRPLDDSEEG